MFLVHGLKVDALFLGYFFCLPDDLVSEGNIEVKVVRDAEFLQIHLESVASHILLDLLDPPCAGLKDAIHYD
jgi:hypothetical protein